MVASLHGLSYPYAGSYFSESANTWTGLLGEAALALADSKEAVRIAPNSPASHLSVATRLLHGSSLEELIRTGKIDKALKHIDKAIELDPSIPFAYYMRAKLFEFTDSKQCLQSLNRYFELVPEVLAVDPERERLLLMRGYVLVNLQRPQEALNCYLAVRKLQEPRELTAELAEALSKTYADLGKYKLGVYYARAFVRADKRAAAAHCYLALFSAKIRDKETAVNAAKEALTLGPSEDTHTWAADTYFELGLHAEALIHYEKALELAPADRRVLSHFGSFLATCPDAKYRDGLRAVTLARQSVADKTWRQWQKGEPLMVLAEALAEQGNFVEAVQGAIEAIESAGPKFGRREEFLEKLATFKKNDPWRARVATSVTTAP